MAASQIDNSPAIGATNDLSTRTGLDDESWQNFKVIRSTNGDHNEHDFKLLLENPRQSILGDTWIYTESDDKYYLDRAILASKSNYLTRLTQDNDEVDMGNMIVNTVHEDGVLDAIFQIMYGKDLKSSICERNFVELLKSMCYLEMEIDLDVFKQFIDETIKPKEQMCHEMIKLYFFMLGSRMFDECKCDYLLPIVSQYFSDRLLEAYKMKEFLSMPYEGLLRILLHRNKDEYKDGGLIGRVCAEWICYDFDTRVVKFIKLVNATKHRFGVFHYCGTDEEESIIDSVKQIDDNVRKQKVEKCFNKLLYHHGDIMFDSSQLADEISDDSQIRIMNTIDQPSRWTVFLKNEHFCDVIIKVQGVTFKLHRIKLLSSSPFFYDLFTKNSKSSSCTTYDKSEKLIETRTLNEIDATAFEKIIRYIYEGEIEITSEYLMISLLKACKFLQMDDLYKECYVWFLNSLCKITGVIFDLFQFLCENERNSDLYTLLVHRILDMWPEFDDCAFVEISLEVLEEIVALPELEMDTADEVIDLCSKWIFYDMEQRYGQIYEIAKAINQNFAPNIKRLKLETLDLENSDQYLIKSVKQLLTKCLSSTALVPSTYGPSLQSEQIPRFITSSTDGALSIVDAYFNEIVSINSKTLPAYSAEASKISIGRHSATVIDDKLFVLFNVDDKFYFYVYLPASKKFISLATDARMNSFIDYMILNCNDEVYYVGDTILLKYCFHLNRWITFWKSRSSRWWFTSDGKMLYRISFQRSLTLYSGVFMTAFYDFNQEMWNRLPDMPILPSLKIGERIEWDNFPIEANVINNDLSVLFKSRTFFFHWNTQTWSSIDNLYEDFLVYAERDCNILYISAEDGVQLYSPYQKKWTADRKLCNFKNISAIHTIM